jgi:hypothetical protein
LGVIGAAVVIVGAFVPFVSFTGLLGFVQPDVPFKFRAYLAAFGVVLLAVALLAQRPAAGAVLGRLAQLVALIGIVGYGVLTAVGAHGINEPIFSGLSITVTFVPGVGLILSAIGCVMVIVSAQRRLTVRP